MSITSARIFDQGTGQEGLDKVREQLARMEESLRERPVYLFPIEGLIITLSAATYAANFPFTLKKPSECSKLIGVLCGAISAIDGSLISSAWTVNCEPSSDGNILVKYMTGLTNGLSYKYSLIVVGV